jgi:hypothetical protein
MTDKEKYDVIFEYLSAAEMSLRNKDYWLAANRCEWATKLAREFAKETIDPKDEEAVQLAEGILPR